MPRVSYTAIACATVAAFILSSLWYSPLLFGKPFAELSGVSAGASRNPGKIAVELARTLVLAYVLSVLYLRLNISDWKSAAGTAIWLWVGFPVILLSGSVLWQDVPWKLAAIHAGDWLLKLVVIGTVVSLFAQRGGAVGTGSG